LQLASARARAFQAFRSLNLSLPFTPRYAREAASAALGLGSDPVHPVRAMRDAADAVRIEVSDTFAQSECDVQAQLVREVFGNPFRRVTVDPNWLTSTVTALARQAYESGDFTLLPILADALQDAGCENGDILNHCRDAHAMHVHGCWVVDLVLGKE